MKLIERSGQSPPFSQDTPPNQHGQRRLHSPTHMDFVKFTLTCPLIACTKSPHSIKRLQSHWTHWSLSLRSIAQCVRTWPYQVIIVYCYSGFWSCLHSSFWPLVLPCFSCLHITCLSSIWSCLNVNCSWNSLYICICFSLPAVTNAIWGQ